jgi:hypothetical protein
MYGEKRVCGTTPSLAGKRSEGPKPHEKADPEAGGHPPNAGVPCFVGGGASYVAPDACPVWHTGNR